ncbi:hypothetical protein NYP18_10820 [Corynebacterium sp. YIM 101645]|uniref:PPE family protein n=1 Tax=Corynebacterium lemuris TaxID=1859292 RepID=A0ABT2FYB9_9CORY|nr:hypothetical protein [Corynebacterium lemuris]MCS5480146.1 hypothetical protein [Corynebacterium lemuris]
MLIDHDSILAGVDELQAIGSNAMEMATEAGQATLNGSFSGVSGLDQLGGAHGGVINGGAGSAITVLQSYAEQVEWLSGALAASYEALTGQNAFVARGMDIADEGGTVGADGVSFPTRPQPRFENFSFTPPMVLPALSIEQLAADFSSTRIAECVAASRLWHALAAETSSIAQSLDAVADELAGSNRGEVIEAAICRISEVARAGDTFAQNSKTMASSVERLSAIKQDGALQVNYARMALGAIADPVQKTAAEQAFLQSFPATYMPSVATGIPPIRNLMVMDGGADGGGQVALGMNEVAGKGSKHDATGNRPPGGTLQALNSVQQAMGTGDFGTVQSGVNDLAGVTGTPLDQVVQAGDIGTTAASTGALPAPPGVGALGTPSFGTGAGGTFGASPVLGGPVPLGGVGNPAATGTTAAGAGRIPLSAPVGGMNPNGMSAPLGALGTAQPGRPGLPTGNIAGSGSRVGGPIGGGAPGGRAVGSVGSAGAGTGAGVAARPPAGTPTAQSAVGGGGASRSTGMGRGMMPMMGAPMAGQGQSKSAKVKTVTSAVEEDENAAALLGAHQPVVPGVIGDWARG